MPIAVSKHSDSAMMRVDCLINLQPIDSMPFTNRLDLDENCHLRVQLSAVLEGGVTALSRAVHGQRGIAALA